MQLERRPPVPLDDARLDDFLRFAHRLADAAGAVTRSYFRTPIEMTDKGGRAGFDPVTAADRGAEAAIRRLIGSVYPEHGVFGEEHGHEKGAIPLTWVVDPIDGTKAFVTGMPLWGTLIALYDGEKPVLGIVDQPYLRERFAGSRLGAELSSPGGSRTLHTRACPELAQAVLYTTHPKLLASSRDQAAFAEVERRVRLSRYGGDCYNYCMLAHGFVDLVIESALKPYDVQALIPLVEAAGGVLSDWAGGCAAAGGQVIAAGDRRVHAQALEWLSAAADQRT